MVIAKLFLEENPSEFYELIIYLSFLIFLFYFQESFCENLFQYIRSESVCLLSIFEKSKKLKLHCR